MDLNDFAIGCLHWDDISALNAEQPIVVPCDCQFRRFNIQNNAVAVTGGTNVVTPRRGTTNLLQGVVMTAAAEGQTTLNGTLTDPQNRFAEGDLLTLLSDGGATSVNQADSVVMLRKMGAQIPNGDFTLIGYFDNAGATETTYIPIPINCRIRKIKTACYGGLTVGTFGILALRKDGPSPTVGANFPTTGIAFTATGGGIEVQELGEEFFGPVDPRAAPGTSGAANIFAAGDRLELSVSGGAGTAEALVFVTFEPLEARDLARYWLTAQFDNIAPGEIGYVPVPYRSFLEEIRCLSYSAGAAATVTVRAAGTVGGDRAFGSFVTGTASEQTVVFNPVFGVQQAPGAGSGFLLSIDNSDRIELDVAGGGTGEVVMLLQFRRED